MIQNIESSNNKINKEESSNKDINTIINNKNKFLYLEKLEKRAKIKLIKRYDKPIWYHDVKMINDILYNEKTHYVEMFKEYLIYEDYNEFLKQYYSDPLLSKKLEKILIFYEKYSKIFPNYTVIKESKYLYKNIKRKQKMINQMNENKKRENYSEEDNYSQSQSYEKTIFNSRVISSIYTGHNTVNLNRTNSTLADNKSIENFLNKISLYEKGTKARKESNKTNKKISEKKDVNKNKKEVNSNINNSNTNINKKNSNLLVTSSLLTPATDSFLKNKINKKNLLENYLNNAVNNVNNKKLMFRPINNFQKQKSFSNIVTNNKKKYGSTNIKHNNVIKNINNYSNSIVEANNLINKHNTSKNINNNNINELFFNNIYNNNINDSYRNRSNNNINNYFDYDKYKKIILSTNNTSSHKILTERVFSSPGRIKNVFFIKKKYKSSSKNKNKNKNTNNNNNNNNNLNRKNISSNIFNKIQKKNKNNNKNNNNDFRERKKKKIFKCQISKQNKKKLINNFNPESVNKLYANNISNLNIKNKNNRNNNTFYNHNNNNSKSKIVNNYNIMSGIMNNSTQINIYTGNDLIKSLNLYWNSIINSTKGPSGINEKNLHKKKAVTKSLSKKGKKIKNENLKKFLEKHWKEKKYKEPYTERNNNNEKILKLLDIYCRDAKKFKSTNSKNNISKNKLNKSHNYNYNHNSKSNLEIKSIGEANKKISNNDLIKDKDKDKEKNNNNMNNLIIKKYNYYKNKNLKERKK